MKATFTLFLSAFCSLFFVSCLGTGGSDQLGPEDYTTASVSELYQMDVPKYMKSATDLNYEASMQFESEPKQAFVVVIDDNKTDFVETFQDLGIYEDSLSVLDNYSIAQADNFIENTNKVAYQSEMEAITVGDLDARRIEFHATLDNFAFEVGYILTFVEGDSHLYMIATWTSGDRMNRHRNTFHTMADSFKEL